MRSRKKKLATSPLPWNSYRSLLFWVAAAALLAGGYLLYAWAVYGLIGFPLDDAWIHQTYARNLGILGQWVFQPGEMSAGSTAPLWSILLALGYRLGIPHLMWTYSLGVLALGVNAWLAARLSNRLLPGRPVVPWLAGMAVVMQWQLVWAAVSGMETLLFSGLGLGLMDLITGDRHLSSSNQWAPEGDEQAIEQQVPRLRRWFVAGLLGGLLVLTRPEGLLLVGLAALSVTWQLRHNPHRLATVGALFGIGVALPLLPYLTFHFTLSGHPFPNTLYAKQREYRTVLELYPLGQRWLMVVQTALIGGQVLLLPGFLFAVGHALLAARRHADARRSSQGVVFLLASWWLAHLTLYAWQLPLTYQHGRYQMPVLAAFVTLGVVGSVRLRDALRSGMARRIIERTVLIACTVTYLVFLGLGVRAYAQDVGFIEGEMVTIARWLVANTPQDSLIAVHDIGAVGYFAGRRLLDLAGLITPEVIPIMDDEMALLHFIESQGGRYVVFFPDWSPAYRRMAQDARLEAAFSSGYAWTRAQGRENMTVYRLRNKHP